MNKPSKSAAKAAVGKADLIRPALCFLLSLAAVVLLTLTLIHQAPAVLAASSAPAQSDVDGTGDADVVADTADSLLEGLTGVDLSQSIEVMLLVTVISLAPSILIMMTSFVRLIIVFSLLRSALGTNQTPPNQVLIGLALFLTLFIMAPTIKEINTVAYEPYKNGEINALEAASKATGPLKEFMLRQVSNDDMTFYLDLAKQDPPEDGNWEALGMEVVVPAYITSELKRAFTIGFLLFIPFLVIDIVVASTLMALGMMMLPPTTISLPFKILLFVLVGGWQLLIGSLVQGFN